MSPGKRTSGKGMGGGRDYPMRPSGAPFASLPAIGFGQMQALHAKAIGEFRVICDQQDQRARAGDLLKRARELRAMR